RACRRRSGPVVRSGDGRCNSSRSCPAPPAPPDRRPPAAWRLDNVPSKSFACSLARDRKNDTPPWFWPGCRRLEEYWLGDEQKNRAPTPWPGGAGAGPEAASHPVLLRPNPAAARVLAAAVAAGETSAVA